MFQCMLLCIVLIVNVTLYLDKCYVIFSLYMLHYIFIHILHYIFPMFLFIDYILLLVIFQALHRDLDNFQSQLSSLYQLSDSVTKNMDTSSITNLTSRLSSLDQRVMALRQILQKQVQILQGDLSQRQRFKALYDAVSAFVDHAARTLGEVEPSKTSETQILQSRHEKLKLLTTKFANNMTELDSLNDLGYRLALDEATATKLRELNHKWHELYSDTKERSKDVQGALLVQQDFTGKCDTWMTFLAETEQDLSTEIGGNLPELISQLRKCEVRTCI